MNGGDDQLPKSMSIEKNLDDDGRDKRTGTWLTASAHIITAVIGSGVLSLAWAVAQLGWIAGVVVLMVFSCITYFTSTMLADCYRAPHPVTGRRNYTYMDVVKAYLGGGNVTFCGIAQYSNLIGVAIGYTITSSISMVAVARSNCFHKHGHQAKCDISNYPFMSIFACIQILLSQIPNFHKLSWLSILAATMSFAYAFIGIGLSVAKVFGAHDADVHATTTLTGTTVGVDVTGSQKVWRSFQAIGNIAFAYAFSTVLIEIQVFSQPVFMFVEKLSYKRWPENKFVRREFMIRLPFCGTLPFSPFRLIWRTSYVIVTSVVAMILPFFNDFLGLIGAMAFWPLTVYLPIEMYIVQSKIEKCSLRWILLKILSFACLIVSLVAAAGSVEGLIQHVKAYKPFQSVQ
ncbi:hypothetical protein ACFE04_004198 [Oxalis oulophora]